MGALVHRGNHWFALKLVDGKIYEFDSLKNKPLCLGTLSQSLNTVLMRKYSHVFPMVRNILLSHRGDRMRSDRFADFEL